MWLYCKNALLCVNPDNLSNLNPAALGGTHQFKVKSNLSPLPPLPLFEFLPLSCFSYLFLFPFCNNYVRGGKCNYKGVELGVGARGDCYACTTKCNIKKLLSEKGTFWQIYGGGQLPPYVCGDGDNKSGSNYQSSSGEPVKTVGRARSD